jgi:hypothetical protein
MKKPALARSASKAQAKSHPLRIGAAQQGGDAAPAPSVGEPAGDTRRGLRDLRQRDRALRLRCSRGGFVPTDLLDSAVSTQVQQDLDRLG